MPRRIQPVSENDSSHVDPRAIQAGSSVALGASLCLGLPTAQASGDQDHAGSRMYGSRIDMGAVMMRN